MGISLVTTNHMVDSSFSVSFTKFLSITSFFITFTVPDTYSCSDKIK